MVLHNPNNWHWVDKNCIYWSREYFAKELVGVKAEDDKASAEVSELKSLEGDVDVCQRKGKVISLFDLNMELVYKGVIKGGEEPIDVTGKISVPEIAYDSDPDDYEFAISIDSEAAAKEPVKLLIRKKIVPQLRLKLHQFGKDLIETHGKDIQHQNVSNPLKDSVDSHDAKGNKAEDKIVATAAYNTTSLQLDAVFSAPAMALYDAFTKPEMVAAWTRSKPDIKAEVGSKYSLFGGNISGEILKLVPGETIDMTWRLRDWKPDHYANLSLVIKEGAGESSLKVHWTGIPIGQEEVVESNFEEYYVKSIKITFGFGAVL